MKREVQEVGGAATVQKLGHRKGCSTSSVQPTSTGRTAMLCNQNHQPGGTTRCHHLDITTVHQEMNVYTPHLLNYTVHAKSVTHSSWWPWASVCPHETGDVRWEALGVFEGESKGAERQQWWDPHWKISVSMCFYSYIYVYQLQFTCM